MNKFYFTRTSKTESLNTLEQNGPKTSKFTRKLSGQQYKYKFPYIKFLGKPLSFNKISTRDGNTVNRLKNFRKCLKFDFNPELCLDF